MMMSLSDIRRRISVMKQRSHNLQSCPVQRSLPASIVSPAFHVANAQLPQMRLKKRNAFKEELLLQGLGAGRDNYTLSAANRGQQIGAGFSRSSTSLNNEMLALLNCLLHCVCHL